MRSLYAVAFTCNYKSIRLVCWLKIFFRSLYSLEVCQIDFTTYLDLTSRSNLWMMARSWPPGQVVQQLVCTTIGFLDNLY